MPYVPGLKYDVFISYAQANDHDGWVSTFTKKLRDYLNEWLPDEPAMFFDADSIKPNEILSESIADSVRESAIMVVIVSKKYLTRPWCATERETFLKVDGPQTARRIVIVRYDDVPFDEWQKVLPGCLGIEFFDKTGLSLRASTQGFRQRLYKLREVIKEELESLKLRVKTDRATATPQSAPIAPIAPVAQAAKPVGGPRLFVAPVATNPEMISYRDLLLSNAKDAGIETYQPSDFFFMEPEFTGSIRAELSRCHGFVQLLDSVPQSRPPNLEMGIEAWMLENARFHPSLAILRWRRSDPLSGDQSFATFTTQPDVRSFEFARFCEIVRDDTRQAFRGSKSATAQRWAVFRHDKGDDDAKKQIAEMLQSECSDVVTLALSSKKSIKDVVAGLQCGAVVLIAQNNPLDVLSAQELRALKSDPNLSPHWAIAIWDEQPDECDFRIDRLKDVHVIIHRDSTAIDRFRDEIRSIGGRK